MKRIDKFSLLLSIPVAIFILLFMAMLAMTGVTMSNAQAEEAIGGVRIPTTTPETVSETPADSERSLEGML